MFDELTEVRRIRTVFQPIIDVRGQAIGGYEALSRGPVGTALEGAEELFAAAQALGRTAELDIVCAQLAFKRFRALNCPGMLFVNLSPETFVALGEDFGTLMSLLKEQQLDPGRMVFELTEHSAIETQDGVYDAVKQFRKSGLKVAMDDLGAGYSGLTTWSKLRPDFVKLDRHFVSGIQNDPIKFEFFRSMLDIARACQSMVIAEGVETAEECREMLALNVDFVQGYFFAGPVAKPEPLEVARVFAPCLPANWGDHDQALVGHIAVPKPTLQVHDTVRSALARMQDEEDLGAMPVLDGTRPLGVVRREDLLLDLSRAGDREALRAKPVCDVMDSEVRMVDAGQPLEQTSRLLTRTCGKRLEYEFIITDRGDYLGMGLTLELLKRITDNRITRRRSSNALTSLPGRVPLEDHIDLMIRAERRFVTCLFDLDNFKPFNDYYGHTRGDDVLLHTAKLLTSRASPRVDFVSHIGDDRFIMVFRSDDWKKRLNSILSDFEASVLHFYDPQDRKKRHIKTIDSDGRFRKSPFLTLSVGGISQVGDQLASAAAIEGELRTFVLDAKAIPGNSLVLGDAASVGLSIQQPTRFVIPANTASV